MIRALADWIMRERGSATIARAAILDPANARARWWTITLRARGREAAGTARTMGAATMLACAAWYAEGAAP